MIVFVGKWFPFREISLDKVKVLFINLGLFKSALSHLIVIHILTCCCGSILVTGCLWLVDT